MNKVFARTNWALLAEQKVALIEAIARGEDNAALLEGLLNFIDAVQDAACDEGHPVVFVYNDEFPERTEP